MLLAQIEQRKAKFTFDFKDSFSYKNNNAKQVYFLDFPELGFARWKSLSY